MFLKNVYIDLDKYSTKYKVNTIGKNYYLPLI